MPEPSDRSPLYVTQAMWEDVVADVKAGRKSSEHNGIVIDEVIKPALDRAVALVENHERKLQRLEGSMKALQIIGAILAATSGAIGWILSRLFRA